MVISTVTFYLGPTLSNNICILFTTSVIVVVIVFYQLIEKRDDNVVGAFVIHL